VQKKDSKEEKKKEKNQPVAKCLEKKKVRKD